MAALTGRIRLLDLAALVFCQGLGVPQLIRHVGQTFAHIVRPQRLRPGVMMAAASTMRRPALWPGASMVAKPAIES
jgi:hypothetical protein